MCVMARMMGVPQSSSKTSQSLSAATARGSSDDLTRHRDSQSHRQSSMQAISDLPCAMIGEFALSLSVGYFRCLQSDEGLAAAVRRAQLQSAAH